MSNAIVVFQGKNIRRAWHNNEWWFSVFGIISILTDSADPKQYVKKMRSHDPVLNANWSTICTHLELSAPDGKKRETNCVNTEGAFRRKLEKDTKTTIEEFIEEREKYYLKIFDESDVIRFAKEAQNYIELHNEFHTPYGEMVKRGQISNKEIMFKNRCSRVFLGIAIELMIKTVYLKRGYSINKHNKPNTQQLIKLREVEDLYLITKTHSLHFLIKNLNKVLPEHKYNFEQDIRKGLELARIWRNVNTHTMTGGHIQWVGDYRSICCSIEIIRDLVLSGVLSNP